MIERKKIPFQDKWNFLIKNWDLSKAVFHRTPMTDEHKTPEAIDLVNRARVDLSFSLRTSPIDVYMSLKRVWVEIAKEAVARQ